MPRYQRQSRIATLQGKNLLAAAALSLLISLGFLTPATTVKAQTADDQFPVYYLTQTDGPPMELPTHQADFAISFEGGPEGGAEGSTLRGTLVSRYRIRNPGGTPAAVSLRLGPAAEGAAPITAPIATARGVPLTLTAQEDGGFTAALTLAADEQVDIDISYSSLWDDATLPAVIYDLRNLLGWPGRLSLRVSMTMPESIDAASWVTHEPDDWSDDLPENAQQTAIKWLYEASWPTTPIRFRFVQPGLWQTVRQAEAAAGPGSGPDVYAQLGDLYRDLYETSLAVDSAGDSTGERFYAQALGAYTTGLAEADTAGASATVTAPLHAGLARLYRSRIVGDEGRVDGRYVELMMQAAAAALDGLPADAAAGAELRQWRDDGLRQLLTAARARGDWQQVTQLLTLLEQLPSSPLAPDELAEEKRIAAVQQALQLLRSGHREAASALAGPEIVAAALAPQTSLPLVNRWQMTVTITPDGAQADILAEVPAEGAERARTAFNERIAQWRNVQQDGVDLRIGVDEQTDAAGNALWQLELDLPTREHALALAAVLPPTPDWALLRTVLQQTAPQRIDRSGWLRHDVEMAQSYDLSAVAELWDLQAGMLTEQAAALEAQGNIDDLADIGAVEAALQASVQSVNYANAAALWQNLSDGSTLVTRMQLPDGLGQTERSWLTTVTMQDSGQEPGSRVSPSFVFQSRGVNPRGSLLLVLLVVVLLLIISALLWRLLG